MDSGTITIICSVLTLAGTVITVLASSHKQKVEQAIKSEFMQAEINEIKKDVAEHNNYAISIPLILQKIEFIEKQFDELRKELKNVT